MSKLQRAEITPELLRGRLAYCPTTGNLRWKNGPRAGKIATCPDDAYLRVVVGGVNLAAHRAIWALVMGHWPQGVIDHINCVSLDNRLANLRDVSALENARNKRPRGRDAKAARALMPKPVAGWQLLRLAA